MTTRTGLHAPMVAAVLLATGCAGGATRSAEREPATATPTATATRAPTTMTRADAFEAALAAAVPLADDWSGTGTGTVDDVTVCDEPLAVPGITDGVFAETQDISVLQGEDDITQDVHRLQAVVAPITDVDATRPLLRCGACSTAQTAPRAP